MRLIFLLVDVRTVNWLCAMWSAAHGIVHPFLGC